MHKTLLAVLILAALVAVPVLAAGTWTNSALVVEIHGTIDESGVYLTDVRLNDGGAVFTARCNGAASELPQVCADLVVGESYLFDGYIRGGGELQITTAEPSQVTEPVE